MNSLFGSPSILLQWVLEIPAWNKITSLTWSFRVCVLLKGVLQWNKLQHKWILMYCYFLRLQKLPLFRELFRESLVIGLGAKFWFVGIFKFSLERKGFSLLFHLILFSSLTIQRIDLIALIAFSFQMDVLPCHVLWET